MPEQELNSGMVLTAKVKQAMSDDIADCQLSREQIAEQLSAITGVRVSVAMINDYAAQTKTHKFPLAWIPGWCSIVRSQRLFSIVVKAMDLHLATPEDMKFAKYGRLVLDERRERDALSTVRRMELFNKTEARL